MKEVWKDIPGYEGLYQASTEGRIRSLDREVTTKNGQERFYQGKIRKLGINKDNGFQVALCKDGKSKTIAVHVLIALTFSGERPPGYDICHLNGNSHDNRLDNLRYDTKSQNQIDIYRCGGKHGKGKLSIDEVLEIRRLYATGDYNYTKLAKIFDVGMSSIGHIVKRKTFTWLNDDGTINQSDSAVS